MQWEMPDWVGNLVSLIVGAILSQVGSLLMLRSDRRKRDAEANNERADAAVKWEQLAARAAETMEKFLAEKKELEKKVATLERKLDAEQKHRRYQQRALEQQAAQVADQEKIITRLVSECSELRATATEQEAQIKRQEMRIEQLTQERDELLGE